MTITDEATSFEDLAVPSIEETPNYIQHRRIEVLDRYDKFHKLAFSKRGKICDVRDLAQFKNEANDIESLMREALATIENYHEDSHTSLQSKMRRHETIEAQLDLHKRYLNFIFDHGNTMIAHGNEAHKIIETRLRELKDLWVQLELALQAKAKNLDEELKMHNFKEVANDVLNWIRTTQSILHSEFGGDGVNLDAYDYFLKNLQSKTNRVVEVELSARKVLESGVTNETDVLLDRDAVREAWDNLMNDALRLRDVLFGAEKVKRMDDDVAELNDIIKEKIENLKKIVLPNKTKKELASNVEKINIEIGCLRRRVQQVESDAKNIEQHEKIKPLLGLFNELEDAVKTTIRRLDNHLQFEDFMSGYNDLVTWSREAFGLMNQTELPVDVESAVQSVMLLRDLKGEIDANQDNFEKQIALGKRIDTPDLSDRIEDLETLHTELEVQFEDRLKFAQKCVDLRQWQLDADKLQHSISRLKELFSRLMPLDPANCDSSHRKFEDYCRKMTTDKDSLSLISERARTIGNDLPNASEVIIKQLNDIRLDWRNLEELCQETKIKIDFEERASEFFSEIDRLSSFIEDKGQDRISKSSVNKRNLELEQRRLAKFMHEMKIHNEKIDGLAVIAEDLDKNGIPGAKKRLEKLIEQWQKLHEENNGYASFLESAVKIFALDRKVSDFTRWIEASSGLLQSNALLPNDNTRNSIVLKARQKAIKLLGHEYYAHEEICHELEKKVQELSDDTIRAKFMKSRADFIKLESFIKNESAKLQERLKDVELLSKIHEELSWVDEKRYVTSKAINSEPSYVRNALKQHQAIRAELINHANTIDEMLANIEKYLEQQESPHPDIEVEANRLAAHFAQLRDIVEEKEQLLESSLAINEYNQDVREAQLWMRECEKVVNSYTSQTRDEELIERVLRQLAQKRCDTDAFIGTIQALREKADFCGELETDIGSRYAVVTKPFKSGGQYEISLKKGSKVPILNDSDSDYWEVDIDGINCQVSTQFLRRASDEKPFEAIQKAVEREYYELVDKIEVKKKNLEAIASALRINCDIRDYSRLVDETNNKLAATTISVEQMRELREVLKRKLGDLVRDVNEASNVLPAARKMLESPLEVIREKWQALADSFANFEEANEANEAITKWIGTVEELNSRIAEKEVLLDVDVDGSTPISKMKQDFDAARKDVDALCDMSRRINNTAESLRRRFPATSSKLYSQQRELQKRLESLISTVDDRNCELRHLAQFHEFLAVGRELDQWIEAEKAILTSDAVADDVEGVEVQLETLSERHEDLDDKIKSLQNFQRLGAELLAEGSLPKQQIEGRLAETNVAFEQLGAAIEEKHLFLADALNEKLFYRHADKLDAWLDAKEELISLPYVSTENINSLISRQEELVRAIEKQKHNFTEFDKTALKLLTEAILRDRDSIANRHADTMDRWERLQQEADDLRARIGEEQSVYDFTRQADAAETWMTEKFVALEELEYIPISEHDKVNQLHSALKDEINEMKNRIDTILMHGQDVLENSHRSMDKTDAVMDRINRIQAEWERLHGVFNTTTNRVARRNKQHRLDELATDIEDWLSQAEPIIRNQDLGKDVKGCDALLKKTLLLDAELEAYEEKAIELATLAPELPQSVLQESVDLDKEEVETTQSRIDAVVRRLDNLHERSDTKKHLLEQAREVHQLVEDIIEQDNWMAEKELLLHQNDLGRDLRGVTNLIRRHCRLEEEIISHDRLLTDLRGRCDLIDQKLAGKANIPERLQQLQQKWLNLNEAVQHRGRFLADGRSWFEFAAQVDEELDWLNQVSDMLAQPVDAQSFAAILNARKKQQQMQELFNMHTKRISELQKQKEDIFKANLHEQLYEEKYNQLEKRLVEVGTLIEKRSETLEEAAACLNFIWRCDTLESWILDQMHSLNTFDEPHEKIEIIHVAQSQIHAFIGKVEAFETTEMLNCEKVLNAIPMSEPNKHIQERWEALSLQFNALKLRLDDVQQRFSDEEKLRNELERLWLEFAHVASIFNVWSENAEDELTDPIRCLNVAELEKSKANYSRFIASLEDAKQQISHLYALDRKAKSISLSPNTFSWFRVDGIELLWSTIKQWVKERAAALEIEEERQTELLALKKEFARYANFIADETSRLRTRALEADRTPEEQVAELRKISSELSKKRKELMQMDELGVLLEQNMLATNEFTPHSRIALAHAWSHLEKLVDRLLQYAEQQLKRTHEKGIEDETVKDFLSVFHLFDKKASGYVSHLECLKCLSILGIDVGEVEDSIITQEQKEILMQLDPTNTGFVFVEAFIPFMIAHETPDVHHGEDLLVAFKALLREERPYITRRELYAALPKEEADFCVRFMKPYIDNQTGHEVYDAFNYESFVDTVFH